MSEWLSLGDFGVGIIGVSVRSADVEGCTIIWGERQVVSQTVRSVGNDISQKGEGGVQQAACQMKNQQTVCDDRSRRSA